MKISPSYKNLVYDNLRSIIADTNRQITMAVVGDSNKLVWFLWRKKKQLVWWN